MQLCREVSELLQRSLPKFSKTATETSQWRLPLVKQAQPFYSRVIANFNFHLSFAWVFVLFGVIRVDHWKGEGREFSFLTAWRMKHFFYLARRLCSPFLSISSKTLSWSHTKDRYIFFHLMLGKQNTKNSHFVAAYILNSSPSDFIYSEKQDSSQ